MSGTKFELILEYNKDAEETARFYKEYTFSRGKVADDIIKVTERCIYISGHRTSISGLENILKRTKCNLYHELCRSILYAYMVYGKAFHFGEFKITYGGTEEIVYDTADLVNYYKKDWLFYKIILTNKNICYRLFI